MANLYIPLILLLLNLTTILSCPYCPKPTPSPPPPPPTQEVPCPPPPTPKPKPPHTPSVPKPKPPPTPKPKPPPTPTPIVPSKPPPTSTPCPPPPPKSPKCPIDTLKLDGCVDLLGGLVHLIIGQSAQSQCCPLLDGLADLDAALCLCTVIKAKVLDISVVLPIALEVLVNDCGKYVPSDYQCPNY